MPWWLIVAAALSIVACTPTQDESHKFVSGHTVVHEVFWGADHKTPYPFTTSGEILCVYYPDFGIEVYFEPAGYSKDSSIGTPLNKAAADALKRDGMEPNVPYSIKEGADLSEAVEAGLRLCDKI
ncbi:hypothetical protein [Psychrobacter sp. AOP7-C1-14]|uniref:hypothetical protein n=1 Tax=Psychrobacter sp. AOP7-C1-14 TaxID=3457640 RepID=UPI00402B4B72